MKIQVFGTETPSPWGKSGLGGSAEWLLDPDQDTRVKARFSETPSTQNTAAIKLESPVLRLRFRSSSEWAQHWNSSSGQEAGDPLPGTTVRFGCRRQSKGKAGRCLSQYLPFHNHQPMQEGSDSRLGWLGDTRLPIAIQQSEPA